MKAKFLGAYRRKQRHTFWFQIFGGGTRFHNRIFGYVEKRGRFIEYVDDENNPLKEGKTEFLTVAPLIIITDSMRAI